ncbi:glycosyltransferase [Mycolicibacterium vaccae]|uniref:glycosyltransferase n=1 Tax=Mycolicibacterium vaccae TaxID=1810 RepID=UPI003CF05623
MSDNASQYPRIAIAHDYLTQRGGAEKVVLTLARAFPAAPIFTTLYDPARTYPEFQKRDIRVSGLNRIALLRKFHRLALPVLAIAASGIKVEAEATIVSSSGWAHGFRSSGPKIVYCYSPARWLYQTDAYFATRRLTARRLALSALAPLLRRWDKKQAATATKYFAISTAVQQRIREVYGIESEVLPAPHSIDAGLPQEAVDVSPLSADGGGFYLCISRLLPYKNVDVVINAFNLLGRPLVVVGTGPEERKLQNAAGPSIVFLKNLDDSQIRWLYAQCRAVVSASYEDFGLTPIEAAAFGKPSVVLRWGGFLDTIREGETGLYFDRPDAGKIAEAVSASELQTWDADLLRQHATCFSEEKFIQRLAAELEARKSAGGRVG